MCVCSFFWIFECFAFSCWEMFWELNMLIGSMLSCLLVAFIFMCFSLFWKTFFLQARQLLDKSLIDSFLSSFSSSCLNWSYCNTDPLSFLKILDKISIDTSIHRDTFYLANRFSTTSRSIKVFYDKSLIAPWQIHLSSFSAWKISIDVLIHWAAISIYMLSTKSDSFSHTFSQ